VGSTRALWKWAVRAVLTIVVTVSLTSCARVKHENDGRVVVPSYKLIGCTSSNCALWEDKPVGAKPRYPKQVMIDIDNTSDRGVTGLLAIYDKSVPLDDIRVSIDERYGKWASDQNGTSPVNLWRVEPEKFAIVSSANDDGTKDVTYLAFVKTEGQVFKDMACAMILNPGAFGGAAHDQGGTKPQAGGPKSPAPDNDAVDFCIDNNEGSAKNKTPENAGHVVPPNYALIGCESPACSQLWSDKPVGESALYPKQVIIDLDKASVEGVVATYNKSISIDGIKLSIDEHYGKWALPESGIAPVKLWRVEPERLAIQLGIAESGRKQVTYLAFR